MDSLLRLHNKTVIFSVTGLAMVGNYLTGGIIGLTGEGTLLCQKMACGGVAPSDVPASCVELVEHLRQGGYLATADGTPPSGVRVSSAYLHVTQRCDLSCRFCYSDGTARNAQPDPSLADLARAIGLLAQLGVSRLVISGGEPFLRQARHIVHFEGPHIKGVLALRIHGAVAVPSYRGKVKTQCAA